MKKVLLFFLCNIAILAQAISQNRHNIKGVYKGGRCADGFYCGIWVIKSDGQFIFIDFQNNYLIKIGQGKWTIKNDSFVNFYFGENQLPILKKGKVNYVSDSKESYDSTYLVGQIKNYQNDGIPYASILVNDKFSFVTDSSGKFQLTLARLSVIPQDIMVIKKINGYEVINTKLNLNSNYHKLEVFLPLTDSATCLSGYEANLFLGRADTTDKPLELQIARSSSERKRYETISLVDNNTKELVKRLNNAKMKQPYLSANINQLIAIINQ